VTKNSTAETSTNSSDITAPLREPIYRRIWFASLFSNFGLLIQGVGAAWAMTQMSDNAEMVALVQSCSMLPQMLWSIPSGAIADMFDKRKVALAGLTLSLAAAIALSLLAWLASVSPPVLLAFCFVIGTGMAVYTPAWQASAAEQVPQRTLPQAIALNSISYNIARSFGPAVGGVIVALAGAAAAFATNAMFYLPLIMVLLLWRRALPPSRLPPERVDRAIISGFRYVFHSPPIRAVLIRTFLMGTLGGSVSALMPLIARSLLQGGVLVYGIILGAFGTGAVGGALLVSRARERLSVEMIVGGCAAILGIAMMLVGLSRWTTVTAIELVVAGAMWMLSIAQFNIAVQTAAPRWVAGRALATYQASVTGGIAFGGWVWGTFAERHGISLAFVVSGVLMLVSPLAALLLRMPQPSDPNDTTLVAINEPNVSLALTLRSGPIVVEIEYEIDPERAREFYQLMLKVQLYRQRNGAYAWSLARDIGNASLWTERFQCPTWLDYLHQRSRSTQAERQLQSSAAALHSGSSPIRVRRMLERPFGSVRWRESARDLGVTDVFPLN
jgi:MFS family permease